MIRILTAAAGLALSGLTLAAQAQTPRGPGLLIHGNYCGPGNRAPLPPVDALDAACARHDACTPRGRPASADCNARLFREADAVAHDPRQPPDVQAVAGFVALGATLLPSAPSASAAPHATLQPPNAPDLDEDE